MTPQQIRDAIEASPELSALAALPDRPDAQIAAALSGGIDSTRAVEVEAWRVQRYLIKRGKWRPILAAAEDSEHPANAAAVAAVDMASAAGMMIDLAEASPQTQGMLALLVGHSLMTAEDAEELRSWSRVTVLVTAEAVTAALNEAT